MVHETIVVTTRVVVMVSMFVVLDEPVNDAEVVEKMVFNLSPMHIPVFRVSAREV